MSSCEPSESPVQVYAEAVWFLMHHAKSDDGLAMLLTHYCDDSGSHEDSQYVVIGGPILDKSRFIKLDKRWSRLLSRHRITPPLQMKDFARPHGKYVGMAAELKRALFIDVVTAINNTKVYSLSVSLPQRQYVTTFPADLRKLTLGPYAYAFIVAACLNCYLAKIGDYSGKIAYLIDAISNKPVRDQINEAHESILKNKLNQCTGSLTFDTDTNISALQAADVISWSARRKMMEGLNDEFYPLRDLFSKRYSASGTPVKQHIHHAAGNGEFELFSNVINQVKATVENSQIPRRSKSS